MEMNRELFFTFWNHWNLYDMNQNNYVFAPYLSNFKLSNTSFCGDIPILECFIEVVWFNTRGNEQKSGKYK